MTHRMLGLPPPPKCLSQEGLRVSIANKFPGDAPLRTTGLGSTVFHLPCPTLTFNIVEIVNDGSAAILMDSSTDIWESLDFSVKREVFPKIQADGAARTLN